jgi:hypothetical protein
VDPASPVRQRALVILAAVVALLSLLLFANIPGKGLWHQVLVNAAHGPIFAVIAVLLMLLQPPEVRSSRRAYLTAFVAAFGLGVMIEVLRYLAGRPGSLIDATARHGPIPHLRRDAVRPAGRRRRRVLRLAPVVG